MQKQSAQPSSHPCAAIDIGSNTIRVVVATCSPTQMDILATDEALVRIGESVNATGSISPQKRDATLTVLQQYQALAEKHSARPILAVATEAIRKATNKDEFLADIKQATGLDVQLISGDEEAALTFYGATYSLTTLSHPPAQIGVMDLGGGSTELVVAEQMQIRWHTSLPVGSGWIHDRYLSSDPPPGEDIAVARTFLQTYLQGLPLKRFPSILLATGGTVNTLLRLAQRAFGLDADVSLLTRDDLVRCEGLLRALPAVEIAQRYQLDEKRARILSAGVLIVLAIIERFQLTEIQVSSYGIREGSVLAFARYGSGWLSHIQQEIVSSNQVPTSETFAQSGRRILRERAKKMLEWRADVLKHEDIEAVHKMRVASRRLRAALDAYESACDPKVFKKVYRTTKNTADVLGNARDTDVMIVDLRAQLVDLPTEEQPGIQWLVQRLGIYRQQHQKTLEQFLKKLDDDTFLEQIDACLPKGGLRNGKS